MRHKPQPRTRWLTRHLADLLACRLPLALRLPLSRERPSLTGAGSSIPRRDPTDLEKLA
jgi:hypothetical protein